MSITTTTTLSKYDTTPAAPSEKTKKKEGNALKMPRNNHVITCKTYKNIALFTGDTYTYRGIFKRNSGDFNTKFRGYLVPLDCIHAIRNEIRPQVQGYLEYYDKMCDLPITTNTNITTNITTNTTKTIIQNIDTVDDDY